MRGREFLMKDNYSFDLNEHEAKKSYKIGPSSESSYDLFLSRLFNIYRKTSIVDKIIIINA